ncbi:MAG: peptidoglycan editing factor PgeF [Burkholderiaceae bacterium]|nr:peptidoglycan editing factor PgeF [Burkholderiaceae bacterium]
MNTFIPDWPGLPTNVGALQTVRSGGASAAPYDDGTTGGHGFNLALHVGDDPQQVRQNRALLRALLPAEPAWLTQTHSTTVVDAASATNAPEADASVTTERGVVCVVMTADCLPVLLCDARGTLVAAAHAGWRGLADGVLQATVEAMRAKGAADILAWFGPAIGPQAFEVGDDVRQAFAAGGIDPADGFAPIDGNSGKYLGDMTALARAALAGVGVSRIAGGGLCTVTDWRRFYSFRRDDITGRMASLIWLK